MYFLHVFQSKSFISCHIFFSVPIILSVPIIFCTELSVSFVLSSPMSESKFDQMLKLDRVSGGVHFSGVAKEAPSRL